MLLQVVTSISLLEGEWLQRADPSYPPQWPLDSDLHRESPSPRPGNVIYIQKTWFPQTFTWPHIDITIQSPPLRKNTTDYRVWSLSSSQRSIFQHIIEQKKVNHMYLHIHTHTHTDCRPRPKGLQSFQRTDQLHYWFFVVAVVPSSNNGVHLLIQTRYVEMWKFPCREVVISGEPREGRVHT